jgi:hypothetical protein
MKKYTLEIIILVLLIGANVLIDLQPAGRIKEITKEDGIVETGTAVFYFLAGCFLLYLFARSKSQTKRYFLGTRRNLFLLGAGLLFIFFAGEEISWGQRLFHIHTPDYFLVHNEQRELNIHNLRFLQGMSHGKWKRGIEFLLNSNVLLYTFYFVFAFLVPLAHKYSAKLRAFFEKTSFPIVPLWIGVTFMLNLVINEAIERLGWIGYLQIGELKEANLAVLAFMAVISFYNQDRRRVRALG